MDFSYPAEVDQFRKELRTWLSAHLTDDVVAADRQRGRDPSAFATLRAWDAAVADAGWAAVSWPQEYGGRGATVLEQLTDALGAAHAVMTLAVEYAKIRRKFDKPIGSFQAVQHLCADIYETVELARSGVIHGLWAADAAEPAERHLAALRAKAFAGRLASVADTAIQVFGGIGYTWEHDAHLYLKRLLGWSVFAGGPDQYLEAVGRQLVGQVDRKVLQ